MATKNDITGDTIQTKIGGKDYADGWDRIFGNKNQKHKQQDLTELNADGNRDRGRYGEDLEKEHPYPYWEHYCTVEASLMGVAKDEPCNWCGLSEYEFDEE
jgi:hypothetical protein|tara:strand:- start:85 stop:387 length:303 start_codon:yes stop_codon:yes gene_type:complete